MLLVSKSSVAEMANPTSIPVSWWSGCHLCKWLAELAFYVSFELIEDVLPALSLLLCCMDIFRIKGLNHADAAVRFFEVNGDRATVIHDVLYELPRVDFGKGAFEVESHGPVFCFHSVVEATADPQIYGRIGAAPRIQREIPLSDVIGCDPCIPNHSKWRMDFRFNGDLHMGLLDS